MPDTTLSRKFKGMVEYGISLPPILIGFVLGIIPLILLAYQSFSPFFTLTNYTELLANQTYIQLFVKSLYIGLVATILCLVIAYPVTFWIAHVLDKKYRVYVLIALALPLWLNYVILNYTWVTIYARGGLLNWILMSLHVITEPLSLLYTQVSLYTGFVYIYLPYVLITLYVSMERFDYKLIEAGRDLGASDLRIFTDILFPRTLSGVIAGAIIVYARMAGAYITPTVLGGAQNTMIARVIVDAFRVYLDWEFAAAISILFLLVVTFMFASVSVSENVREEFKQW